MRSLLLVLLFAVSLTSCREDDITSTLKSCKDISEHLSDYRHKVIDLSAQGTESGNISMYLKGNRLVLAVAGNFSETERTTSQYFFDGDDLMCVIEQTYTYNKPTYMTEERAIKNGDSVWYDDTKTKMTTNKYYFYDGNMVKWLDKDGKEVSDKNKKYALQAVLLLRDAEKLKKMNEQQK